MQSDNIIQLLFTHTWVYSKFVNILGCRTQNNVAFAWNVDLNEFLAILGEKNYPKTLFSCLANVKTGISLPLIRNGMNF